jgi:tRNA-specific 2-thiouridylase
MTVETLASHLERPLRRGHTPANACTGAAGGAACGDLIRISLALDPQDPHGRVLDAGFDASGCGAAIAAGSATVALLDGSQLLEAARIGADEIAAELGGLSPAKHHAAELAADALHRALGFAAREYAQLAPVAQRVLVATSGGVDSAVAALLTAQDGAEVVSVTLELWSDPENDGVRSCCSAQAVRGAREVAHRLGMPHLSIDLREEFRAGVVNPWLADHADGLTPNPCVRCNGNVRLDAMLDLADRLGSRTLATGHYARVHEDEHAAEHGPLLRLAVDPAKDQSYVLARLAPDSLRRLRFPLGELCKPQVRELAELAGLAIARKPDSQDLCFLAGTGVSRFLERHGELHGRPGPILDTSGRELGRHGGSHTFTVGQRHGLGIGGGTPLYVLATDAVANSVTVGSREQLLGSTIVVRDATLRREGARVNAVKIRSHGRRIPCRVLGEAAQGHHAHLELELTEPAQRAAPGQMACLFADDLIVGYGTVSAGASCDAAAAAEAASA